MEVFFIFQGIYNKKIMETTKVLNLLGQKEIINFPNVGQLMDIESAKMAFTNGTYSQLVKSSINVASSIYALDLVDALSHFSVLIPDLLLKLGLNNNASILSIDLKTGNKLVEIYRNEYFPWFSKVESQMKNIANVAYEEKEKVKEDLKEANKSLME